MTCAGLTGLLITMATASWMLLFARKNRDLRRVDRSLYMVPLLQFLFFLLLFGDGYGTWMQWFFLLLMTGIDAATCVVLMERKRTEEKKQEMSDLYRKIRQEMEYYEKIAKYLQHMSYVRHEFANQVQVVTEMLENGGDISQIRVMLNKMDETLKSINTNAGFGT